MYPRICRINSYSYLFGLEIISLYVDKWILEFLEIIPIVIY